MIKYSLVLTVIFLNSVLLSGCSSPSLVRDLKKHNVTYLNTKKIIIRGSENDGCANVVVEEHGPSFIIQDIWDRIYLSRPYPVYAFSSWRILELYTDLHSNKPDAILYVNETDETHIEDKSPKDGYRCPGLEGYLMELLIRERDVSRRKEAEGGGKGRKGVRYFFSSRGIITMKTNPHLKAAILQVVDNQINANDPPETKQTLDRLLSEGHSEEEAKRLIGCIVSSEIFDILKKQEEFNLERFVSALNRLPKLPWE